MTPKQDFLPRQMPEKRNLYNSKEEQKFTLLLLPSCICLSYYFNPRAIIRRKSSTHSVCHTRSSLSNFFIAFVNMV